VIRGITPPALPLLVGLCVGWVCLACQQSGEETRANSAPGTPTSFSEPPGRVVSLVPSATQALRALGVQDRLVGRTEHDTEAELAHLPSVGGGLEPNLEALVLLEPDLVIGFDGESDLTTPERLDDLGIPFHSVRLDRIEDVKILFRELGELFGLQARAEALVAEMEMELADVVHRVSGSPTLKVAYVLGGNPPWVAGPGTFIHELLILAGGENIFADLSVLYGPVSLEEFLVRDMDLILAPEGAEVALPSNSPRLVRVPPSYELPGPNLAQTALGLAQIIHPEAFR
jgi:iron complex transport system substrate-binding protein